LAEVDLAKAHAGRSQLLCSRDMRGAHEMACIKVADAQQALADRHCQLKVTVASERACTAQANLIAAQQKDTQEVDQHVHQRSLESKLRMASNHLNAKAVLPVERMKLAEASNQARAEKNKKLAELANARADREEAESHNRLERAKVALANLQAHCAAHVNDLLRQWEEAKRAGAAKVRAAEARREEVLRYCEECKQKQEERVHAVTHRVAELQYCLQYCLPVALRAR